MKQTKTMKASEIWKSTSEALNDCDYFGITLDIVERMKANARSLRNELPMLYARMYGVVRDTQALGNTSVGCSIKSIESEVNDVIGKNAVFIMRAQALLEYTHYLDKFEIEVETDERGEVDEYDKQEAIGELKTMICNDLDARQLTPHYLPIRMYYDICAHLEILFDDIIDIINDVRDAERSILEYVSDNNGEYNDKNDILRDDLRKGLRNMLDFDRDLLPEGVTQDTYCYYELFD